MVTDPVTLEILNQRFAAVAREMVSVIHRTSRSTFVKEAMDFGVGLVDRHGRMFAFPRGANTFSIDRRCTPLIEAVPDVEPGDVICTNDPYASEGLITHVPDLNLLRPFFHEGQVVGYGWCFAHLTDVGGAVPGSLSARLNSIFQEGIRFPPMKLMRAGRMNPVFERFFRANSRIPEVNMGDLNALLGSLAAAQRRMTELCTRFGAETVIAVQAQLQDYAAAKAREVLRRIPDGRYEFWDYLDDDLVTPYPVRVRACLTARDGEIEIDLTGTDPQSPTSYNCPALGERHYWLLLKLTNFMLTHDGTIPLNAGIYRSVRTVNPDGSIMKAAFPDAVGFRTSIAIRCNDAITGALLCARDDLLPAPAAGCTSTLALSQFDDAAGKPVVRVIQPMRGGMGAYRGRDGIDGRDVTVNNMRNHPVEIIEAECGLLVRDYDIRPDSGGAGTWRGGNGQSTTLEALHDDTLIIIRGAERFRFTAWGVAGGQPGAPYEIVVNRGRPDERSTGKLDRITLARGETLTVSMPGAAGFGDPLARDPDAVARDVLRGFVSRHHAEALYGVACHDDGTVDAAATAQRRHGRNAAHIAFGFGQERLAWESVFDDRFMLDFNAVLARIPKSTRAATRIAVFTAALPGLAENPGASLVRLMTESAAARARAEAALGQLRMHGADHAIP